MKSVRWTRGDVVEAGFMNSSGLMVKGSSLVVGASVCLVYVCKGSDCLLLACLFLPHLSNASWNFLGRQEDYSDGSCHWLEWVAMGWVDRPNGAEVVMFGCLATVCGSVCAVR